MPYKTHNEWFRLPTVRGGSCRKLGLLLFRQRNQTGFCGVL
jgi:hypothetical protein